MKFRSLNGKGEVGGWLILGFGGGTLISFAGLTSGNLWLALLLGAINVAFQYFNFGGWFDGRHKTRITNRKPEESR